MKQKYLIAAVVVLLLLNSAMIVYMWSNRPEKQGPRPQGPVDDFLRRELSLTPDQEKKFEEERQRHFEAMRPAHEEAKKNRDALFDQISNSGNTNGATEKYAQLLASVETKKEVQTVEHFRRLRSLLTDDQKKKFDKIFKDVLRMMSGRGPGGPEGRPPHEGGPPPHELLEERRSDSIHP